MKKGLPRRPNISALALMRGVTEAASTTIGKWRMPPSEPVITILPDPVEAPVEVEIVPEVEVTNLRVAELQHVARAFRDLGLPIESNVAPPAVFSEDEPQTILAFIMHTPQWCVRVGERLT